MKFTRFIAEEDKEKLQFEVVSQDLKIHLTRLLDKVLPRADKLVCQNHIINKSRSLVGLPIYVLEGYVEGYDHLTEEAWHDGEFQLVFRRLDTVQFVEFVCELIEEEFFDADEVNQLLERDGLSFRIGSRLGGISVEVFPIEKIESLAQQNEHPNIRVLVKRMDDALTREDYAGVLHASASIFETMAKDIIGASIIKDQSLGGFIDRYRKDSTLPKELLDYVSTVYSSRNVTPLAGHGSTQAPTISKEEAIALAEMTRAFVRIEYRLQAEVSKIVSKDR